MALLRENNKFCCYFLFLRSKASYANIANFSGNNQQHKIEISANHLYPFSGITAIHRFTPLMNNLKRKTDMFMLHAQKMSFLTMKGKDSRYVIVNRVFRREPYFVRYMAILCRLEI